MYYMLEYIVLKYYIQIHAHIQMVEHDVLLKWGCRFNLHQLYTLCHDCVVITMAQCRECFRLGLSLNVDPNITETEIDEESCDMMHLNREATLWILRSYTELLIRLNSQWAEYLGCQAKFRLKSRQSWPPPFGHPFDQLFELYHSSP